VVAEVVGVPESELYTVSPSFSELSEEAAASPRRRRYGTTTLLWCDDGEGVAIFCRWLSRAAVAADIVDDDDVVEAAVAVLELGGVLMAS
jgi:hypothetical protein